MPGRSGATACAITAARGRSLNPPLGCCWPAGWLGWRGICGAGIVEGREAYRRRRKILNCARPLRGI